MHTETGEIRSWEEIEALAAIERAKYVQVQRDLTKIEELEKQIALYSPCGCGSGKKFKFCCHTKPDQGNH
jgi:uncharacterized protein YchJ